MPQRTHIRTLHLDDLMDFEAALGEFVASDGVISVTEMRLQAMARQLLITATRIQGSDRLSRNISDSGGFTPSNERMRRELERDVAALEADLRVMLDTIERMERDDAPVIDLATYRELRNADSTA